MMYEVTFVAASGLAIRCAAPAIRVRAVSSAASARIRFASVEPVVCSCSTISAAPAIDQTSAFFRWWSSVAVGSGIRIAGFPAAATSASVVAPARQTIRSAVPSCRPMS